MVSHSVKKPLTRLLACCAKSSVDYVWTNNRIRTISEL